MQNFNDEISKIKKRRIGERVDKMIADKTLELWIDDRGAKGDKFSDATEAELKDIQSKAVKHVWDYLQTWFYKQLMTWFHCVTDSVEQQAALKSLKKTKHGIQYILKQYSE